MAIKPARGANEEVRMASKQTAEQQRLEATRDRIAHWKLWGPYLAERAWATVREDYSPYGSAWDYFPHDHARSRIYRWNEDGDDFTVEYPTGSGQSLTLNQIADELSHRLIRIFLRDGDGRRAVFGGNDRFQDDPDWRDNVLFYEYFHGDNGAGAGASHQTGWTGLVAKLIQQQGEHYTMPASEPVAAPA
jgi:hypothetical protein